MQINKGVYYAGFTAFLWGFLAIALKVMLSELPPITVTWFRFSISFVLLTLYYLIFDRTRLNLIKKPPLFALIAAVCLMFNYLGYIAGIELTSPTIGQVFIQMGPVLLAVSGFVIFKEKVNPRQGIGLLLVVTGLVVFYNEQIVKLAGGLKDYKIGVLFVLFGALSWSIYAIFQKIAVRRFHPMQLNLIIFGLPSILLIPMVSFQKLALISFNDWLLLVFLGLNTLGAYGTLAYAFKYLEANKISVILILNPLITMTVMALLGTLSVTWIKPEVFSTLTIIGAITVLTGAVLTVFKNIKN